MAGLWQHHQVRDGTYTFADLMDAHEILDVREKNEIDLRAYKEAQKGE